MRRAEPRAEPEKPEKLNARRHELYDGDEGDARRRTPHPTTEGKALEDLWELFETLVCTRTPQKKSLDQTSPRGDASVPDLLSIGCSLDCSAGWKVEKTEWASCWTRLTRPDAPSRSTRTWSLKCPVFWLLECSQSERAPSSNRSQASLSLGTLKFAPEFPSNSLSVGVSPTSPVSGSLEGMRGKSIRLGTRRRSTRPSSKPRRRFWRDGTLSLSPTSPSRSRSRVSVTPT
mmetsp:Transcript_16294/g.33065  ORF Transcript_16294/g.33065 Transcript_16294/m.33065 type:complete len:231 (-) Transcript_16294:2568-3260(-)